MLDCTLTCGKIWFGFSFLLLENVLFLSSRFKKFHVLVPFVWCAWLMAWHVQLWGTCSPLALRGAGSDNFGGGFGSKIRTRAEPSLGSPECKETKSKTKFELSKVYFFNWKCKFINIFRSWNVVVTYWVGGDFFVCYEHAVHYFVVLLYFVLVFA